MSANLDLVRSIYVDWERGDFGKSGWADREFELVIVDGPTPGTWTGAGLAEGTRQLLGSWKDLRVLPQEYRELDGGRVLVLLHNRGRARTSGMDLDKVRGGVNLLDVRDGKVVRLVVYWDRDRAFADLGLEQ